MAVTLAQAQLNTQDDIVSGVIDEFRKSSFILNNIIFKDCVSPTGGGGTMTYGYTRVKTQAKAGFRSINNEYTASEAEKERITVDLKIFGGSYQIDRIINNMGGIINEVEFQSQQKIKATNALFNDTFINGDSGTNEEAFDGLDKAITGSSTEYNTAADDGIDLSTSPAITSNYMTFLDMLDEFLSGLDGTPSFIGGNTKLCAKIRACARRASMYQTGKNDLGTAIEYYGNTPIIDFGAKSGSNNDVVATDTNGYTSLYAGRFGLDGLHAVSMPGSPITAHLPDYNTAGAVKKGDVEMVAAIVLKATKAAGVFRKIKVK